MKDMFCVAEIRLPSHVFFTVMVMVNQIMYLQLDLCEIEILAKVIETEHRTTPKSLHFLAPGWAMAFLTLGWIPNDLLCRR